MTLLEDRVREIAAQYTSATGGVITSLRALQDEFQCIPESADRIVAEVFNLSRAEVRGIVSFYADFTRDRKAATVIRMCVAEACQAAGARQLQGLVSSIVDDRKKASTGNDIEVEAVYCLGLCSAAPAAMIGEKLVGRADADRIAKTLSAISKDG